MSTIHGSVRSVARISALAKLMSVWRYPDTLIVYLKTVTLTCFYRLLVFKLDPKYMRFLRLLCCHELISLNNATIITNNLLSQSSFLLVL
jgi:hypothetical protein